MLGCRACEQLTGGNCGAHGPTYIPILGSGPTGLPIMTPEFAAAAVHRLEQERLERIVIAMGAENKRLELKVERLQRELKERGEVNAKLNRELQRARSVPK